MKKSRFTEQQIVSILKQSEAGEPVGKLVRRHGISEMTFYRWKKKYSGVGVSEAKRLKRLEEENRRLKRVVADQALNLQVLNELLGKDF
jgi:putative transposase